MSVKTIENVLEILINFLKFESGKLILYKYGVVDFAS